MVAILKVAVPLVSGTLHSHPTSEVHKQHMSYIFNIANPSILNCDCNNLSTVPIDCSHHTTPFQLI